MSGLLQNENNNYRLPRVQGLQGKYYVVDGKKYDTNFPDEWALNHLASKEGANRMEMSGPAHCANCLAYGSINGVFVFYCGNCTRYINKGTRGGNLYCNVDITEGDLWRECDYMNGVLFDEIGDTKDPTHRSELYDWEFDEKEQNSHMRKLTQRQNKKG